MSEATLNLLLNLAATGAIVLAAVALALFGVLLAALYATKPHNDPPDVQANGDGKR